MSATIHHDATAAQQFLAAEEALRKDRARAARRRHVFVHVGGRGLVAALFLISGFAKLFSFGSTSAAMYDVGIGSAEMLLTAAIAIELVGGLMIAIGLRTREAALALIAYVITVTLVVNGDLAIEVNRIQAVSNIGLIGGLLLLVSHGAGAYSADTEIARRQARQFRAS